MGSKLDETTKEDKKRARKIPELATKFPAPVPAVDISQRRIRRITPIGDFKQEGAGALDVNKLIGEAKQQVSAGANPGSTVTVILQDKEGRPAVEQNIPLGRVAELEDGDNVYDKLEDKGGWVRFGGGDDGGGGIKEKAINWALKFGGVIAKKGLETKDPGERRRYAEATTRFISTASDVLSDGIPAFNLAAATGEEYSGSGLRAPKMPSKWHMIGEASRIGFIWMMDQQKFRFQYTMMGKFIWLPWSRKNYYEEQRKKMKKIKKMSDLEKRLDIFSIDIEDVFDIDTLAMEEIWELDDIEKVKPTMDEYHAMTKLMKEEGYYDYAEAVTAFKEGVR